VDSEGVDRLFYEVGLTGSREFIEAKAQQLGWPFIDLGEHQPEKEALQVVPGSLARLHRVLPFRLEEDVLWVAMADPGHIQAIEDLMMLSGNQILPVLAVPADVDAAIARFYPAGG
jgi:type IV pilus assembly protein PilB